MVGAGIEVFMHGKEKMDGVECNIFGVEKVITPFSLDLSSLEGMKISVDVDGLVAYVMKRADQNFADDFPIYEIEDYIREFFMTEEEQAEICKKRGQHSIDYTYTKCLRCKTPLK